jgi:hypothetical protein
VAPGQRFHENLTKSGILDQSYCGPEAAPAHKQKLADFKEAVSRASIDTKTRVLKVSFKGRTTATKWAGWHFPLAARMLTLIDYEMIRERAVKTTSWSCLTTIPSWWKYGRDI